MDPGGLTGHPARDYGSKGWGFESLRARFISAGQDHLLRCERWSFRLSRASLEGLLFLPGQVCDGEDAPRVGLYVEGDHGLG